jgi:hypothetical protein
MCSAVLTIMPDPLLMNAFNNINLAAACILTSVDFARELGVPEEKWIYPIGGAGTRDSDECKKNATVQPSPTDRYQSGNAQTSPQAHPSHALSTQRYRYPIQVKKQSTCSTSTRLSSSSQSLQNLTNVSKLLSNRAKTSATSLIAPVNDATHSSRRPHFFWRGRE